nr:ribonuclease PH [Alcaligenaceae bacterium]
MRTERAADALRNVQIELGFSPYAEGSALIKMGGTHVLCNASILDKVPPFLKGTGQGWVTAEYGMLPRSTQTRMTREAKSGKPSGRTQEIQRLIGRSLRASIDLQQLGERTIHLDCDVLQADGGTRCASITGAWLALRLAVNHLLQQGDLIQDPLTHQVAAISAGVVKGQVLLDLDYCEDSNCDSDVNVVMTETGHFVEIQGTAEGQLISPDDLSVLLQYAASGIQSLLKLQ